MSCLLFVLLLTPCLVDKRVNIETVKPTTPFVQKTVTYKLLHGYIDAFRYV